MIGEDYVLVEELAIDKNFQSSEKHKNKRRLLVAEWLKL